MGTDEGAAGSARGRHSRTGQQVKEQVIIKILEISVYNVIDGLCPAPLDQMMTADLSSTQVQPPRVHETPTSLWRAKVFRQCRVDYYLFNAVPIPSLDEKPNIPTVWAVDQGQFGKKRERRRGKEGERAWGGGNENVPNKDAT